MKLSLGFLLFFFFASCSDSFINHKLKAERIGDCTTDVGSINMLSNINGEQYSFNECLPDGFDGKGYTVERKGDSLIVSFPAAQEVTKKAMYKLTLDIDAKPAYHHILLNGRKVEVVPFQ